MCQKTDSIRPLVRDAVQAKLDACEAFTSVDISHPLIKKDKEIRHYMVRKIINEMLNDGDLALADFETTTITVYPNGPGSKGVPAVLYHPLGYDVDDYNKTSQVLIRGDETKVPTSTPVSAPTGLPSFRSPTTSATPHRNPSMASLPTNTVVSRKVHRQTRRGTFNIPTRLVQAANFRCGDVISIDTADPNCKVAIKKGRDTNHQQVVDLEGRIRLHGKRADAAGTTATVCVVDNGNDQYICLI